MTFQHKASAEQTSAFNEFKSGKGNVVFQAYAGCAKTTTVVEGINHAPEKSILMCAFAKVNAEELKARISNPNAEAKTLHSAGNSVIYKRAGRVTVQEHRGRNIAQKVIISDFGVKNPTREAVILVTKVASLGKNIDPFATKEVLTQIAKDFGHEPTNDELGDGEMPWTVEQVAACALRAMEKATEYDGTIDFDDMIFLPVRMKWVRPQYDLVVVDEYQDMNPTQLMLARALCKGRMILVGDEFQAIYEFRGANAEFARKMVKDLNAKVMTLSTTFRCPKSVVRAAAELVPGYKAAEQAPEGILRSEEFARMFAQAEPGDFILSRKNAPLAKICLRLLRDGKRALIRGRKIGEGLVNIVKGREARNIPELVENLGIWEKNLVEQYIKQNAPETKVELIQDQAATICFLAEGLASVGELVARIETLFADATPGNSVICSSVHRAKGLEATRVFLLADTLYPGRRKDEEEIHIHYVAITRAKNELVMVRGGVK
jgi:superfamily I DNA/RNA helicase